MLRTQNGSLKIIGLLNVLRLNNMFAQFEVTSVFHTRVWGYGNKIRPRRSDTNQNNYYQLQKKSQILVWLPLFKTFP